MPTILGCLCATLLDIGGAATSALIENEKTVTAEHIARAPLRHPGVVAAGRCSGMNNAHLRARGPAE